MCCGICLDQNSDNAIEVSSDEGKSENMYDLITLHLQIQIEDHCKVCEDCWLRIRDFSTFYAQVKERHKTTEDLLILKTEQWSESDKPNVPIAFVAENESGPPDVVIEVDKKPVTPQNDEPVESKAYKCEVDGCRKTFGKKHSLDVHRRSRHSAKKSSKLNCSECGKDFASKYSLSVHINGVHKGAFARVCEICAKVFKNKTIYLAHQKVFHSDEQPEKIQCQMCGNWLKDANSLRKHMNRHKDEETGPHICKHCGKKSPNKNALKCHIQHVHVKQRVYKCSICDKAFKRQLNLKEHLSVHTGEVLYTCTFCPKTFNSSANMYSHRKKAHKFELESQNISTK